MNNKKLIVALAIIATLALVLSGCDMFRKIKNAETADVVPQVAWDTGVADSTAVASGMRPKLIGDGEVYGIQNPDGEGTAEYSGQDFADYSTYDLTYTDRTVIGGNAETYIMNGGPVRMTAHRMELVQGNDHNSEEHYEMLWEMVCESGLTVTKATDTRKSTVNLSSLYWAGEEAGTVVFSHYTTGKVDGETIEVIESLLSGTAGMDAFN